MKQHLSQHRSEVLQAIAAAPDLFCFLDYDGTLAPIVRTPSEATPLPGTRELLEDLVHAPRTEVALVSGRAVDDVRGFVDIAGLYYVGIHGLEVRRPGEETQTAPGAAVLRERMPEIRRRLDGRLGNRAGVLLEEKGAAIACHYRLASHADARVARDTVVDLVRSYQDRGIAMTFIDGHEVTEIRPLDADKGRTVCALLAARLPQPLALYIGDDRTDEDAFRQLPPSAITIRVGSPEQETLARYRLADPGEVQEFLFAVLSARGGVRR